MSESSSNAFEGFSNVQIDCDKIETMKVKELRFFLGAYGLDTKGRKAELKCRLLQHIETENVSRLRLNSRLTPLNSVRSPTSNNEAIDLLTAQRQDDDEVSEIGEHIQAEAPRNANDIENRVWSDIQVELKKLREENEILKLKISQASHGANRRINHTPREVMEVMPEFDPSNQCTGLTANQFIERIISMQSMFGWSEDMMFFLRRQS